MPFLQPFSRRAPFWPKFYPREPFSCPLSLNPFFLSTARLWLKNLSFLPNSPFLTLTFSKEPNLAPNPLFLLECPFPTPIFSERFILVQTLPKRTFLMPTFSEPIFSQYTPKMAQDPSFLLSCPFLTPNLPKEPSLAQNSFFFSNVPFLDLCSLKAPFWPILYPREPFSCPLSLKSHFGPEFPYFYPNVPFPVQQLFLE